jgi:polar amino acid transport system substrate-binding protein
MRMLSSWVLVVVLGLVVAIVAVLDRGHRHFWSPNQRTNNTPLRVGYAIEPPYVLLDAQGRVSGESPEVLRAALKRMGEPEPIWLHFEFPNLLAALQAGSIDLIAAGMFITPERSQHVTFTRPTARVGTGLLVPSGNPQQLHSLADLARRPDLTLAVIDGSVEAAQASTAGLPRTRQIRVTDALSGIAAVRSDSAAAFALSAPSLRWALQHSAVIEGDAESAAAVELAEPYQSSVPLGQPAYAMRQDDPRLDRLDQALASWLGSAEHLAIAQRYGFSAADLPARQEPPR